MSATRSEGPATSHIFISYSRADAETASTVAKALEHAGLRPWIDLREISPGDSFLERMNEGLGHASYVLLLWSAAAKTSHWVSREWMAALASRAIVIIPILLDDTPPPTILRDLVHISFNQRHADGLRELVNFFQRETRVPKRATFRSPSTVANRLRAVSRRQIRMLALRCLDEAALKSFCFDAQVDLGRLQGTSLHERLVTLLHIVADEGLLASFAQWFASERDRCVEHALRLLQDDPSWTWGVDGR